MSRIAEKFDVPKARPGFEAIGITAPIMMQMNPSGKWENSKPDSLDEDTLQKVVKYLVKSNAVNAAQSYCTQCAADNKNAGGGGKSKYVPVIMMPVYSADNCPFDFGAGAKKLDESKPKKKAEAGRGAHVEHEDKEKKGLKKRTYQLQRLTDFDLLSQW